MSGAYPGLHAVIFLNISPIKYGWLPTKVRTLTPCVFLRLFLIFVFFFSPSFCIYLIFSSFFFPFVWVPVPVPCTSIFLLFLTSF